MGTAPRIFYEFGPFRVDPEKRLLLRENQPVSITPKALETLLVLLRHNQEELVSKDDLMKELWPDAFVEEANLVQNIFTLRKTLGDTPEERRYIVTLPGRGYRFAAEVRRVTQGDLVIASSTRSQFIVEQEESLPGKILPALDAPQRGRMHWKPLAAMGAAVLLLAIGTSLFLRVRRPVPLGEKDSVLIADFTNTTGDPVFDDALRQGLVVQLEQSPFLSLVSDDRVQQTLRLMGEPSDIRVTSDVARGVCERIGSAAVLQGSIENLGTRYVIGLRATNCRTGDLLDVEQAQAARKEGVLSALTEIASRFRTRVGESLATIHQHDLPLAEATTPSLDALKAYSIGWKVLTSNGGDASALPFFQRAVQLDPQFAMAYAWMGRIYGDLGEAALSAQNTARAYELRDRASDRERFWISAAYDMQASENLVRAQQTCEVWARTYPRDGNPHGFLAGVIYPVLGKYEQALQEAKKAEELNPDFAIIYFVLASRYQELGRLDEAARSFETASRRKLDLPDFLMGRYDLAFVRGDRTEMDRITKLAREVPSADEWVTDHEGSVQAYAGRSRDALKAMRRAADLARQAGHHESEALYSAGTAIWEAFFGNSADARRMATEALAISNDRGVEYGAALALALAGDSSRSQRLADDLDRRFPEDTSVQFSYLPTLRAQLALNRGDSAKAIELLQIAAPYELGIPRTALHANFGAMYPVFLRGDAYLAQRRGPEAIADFQKILDHPGIVVSDPIGALAHLQIARAYALADQKANAESAYQSFFTLWKDADLDIPLLKQARGEFSKLQMTPSISPASRLQHRTKN